MAGSADVFSAEASGYDAWFDTDEGAVLFANELAAIRLLWREEFQPSLEVGVGTGRFAQALGVKHGIDPAAGVLKLAQGRGVQVQQACGEALPFADGSFRAVLMIATLCFADDPAALFREAVRVLRPDGKLLIGDIPADSPWGQLYLRKKSEGHLFYRHAHFYTLADLRRMLGEVGLEIEGTASTLLQPPDGPARLEAPQMGEVRGAGFVVMLARSRAAGEGSPAAR